MKRIKTAQLKSQLSHYLREVQSSDEPIEVCVREQPVAYLSRVPRIPMNPKKSHELEKLQQRLSAVGLILSRESPEGSLPEIEPLPAGDGRTNAKTVEEMRAEREW